MGTDSLTTLAPPCPKPLPIVIQAKFWWLKELTQKGLKATSKFISTTILRSQKNEINTLHRIHCYQILPWASWIFWLCNSERWDLLLTLLWRHFFDVLQTFVIKVLTSLCIFQLAGLAVIAFGLWLRFGGVMAEFASDKKPPEYFFIGKFKRLWWQ